MLNKEINGSGKRYFKRLELFNRPNDLQPGAAVDAQGIQTDLLNLDQLGRFLSLGLLDRFEELALRFLARTADAKHSLVTGRIVGSNRNAVCGHNVT